MLQRVTTATELVRRISDGLFDEGHHLEAKREIPSGSGSNRELGRDLASLAVDGGHLVVGVNEDKTTGTFSPHPVPLDGLAERIDQVARERITPHLIIRCRELPTTPGDGFLIVEVPPSPDAPHMVDGRYYGRGDSTKHVLADADVRRLYEIRSRRLDDFSTLLSADVERDPTPSQLREQAHMFVLAVPCVRRPEMLHEALESNGETMRTWAARRVLSGPPVSFVHWHDLGSCRPRLSEADCNAIRANGIGLSTQEVGRSRDPSAFEDGIPRERSLLDVEIDDNGSVHLFTAAVTTSSYSSGGAPLRLISAAFVPTMITGVLRIAVEASEAANYTGTWQIGVHINNVQGAVGYREGRPRQRIAYTAATFEETTEALLDELRDDEPAVARRLCSRFQRGIGMPLPAPESESTE